MKHWHARRQATVQTQSSLAAQLHRTALAARPAGIGGSLTLSGNALVVTVTVQHRLLPRTMSMLANVSRMYAECFDKVLYHVNSRILKCKITNVITMLHSLFEKLTFAMGLVVSNKTSIIQVA
jgi:hypothetical protein